MVVRKYGYGPSAVLGYGESEYIEGGKSFPDSGGRNMVLPAKIRFGGEKGTGFINAGADFVNQVPGDLGIVMITSPFGSPGESGVRKLPDIRKTD